MGFAEPLAFVFSALIGVLVALYLWERRRPALPVASLRLWEQVREDNLRARQFRPDPLFWLQLLALLALIGGLARPFWHGSADAPLAQRHLFVLDTSASMQTREASGSRLDQARAAALAQLDGIAAADEVMLIEAGRAAIVTLPATREHQKLRQALQQAQATDTHGELSGAVALATNLARRAGVAAHVKVFTDWPASRLPEDLRDRVTLFQVGSRADNVAIESLEILQGRFQATHEASVRAHLRNYGTADSHGWLQIRAAGQVILRTGFSLAGGAAQTFSVAGAASAGTVVAEIDVDDGLAADNVAYGWLHPVPPLHVLVVAGVSPLVNDLQELAQALPALQLTIAAPDAVPAGSFDVALFHRVATREWPALPALFIDPPADNPLLPSNGEEKRLEVIDWDSQHPVLRDLRPLSALPLQRALVFTPPAWAHTLLWSRTPTREVPLVFAGEHGGHRAAVIAFDLEAEHLLRGDTLGFFLVFLRLLDWLAPPSQAVQLAQTGDALAFEPGTLESVEHTAGSRVELAPTQGSFTPLRAGEYLARGAAAERRWLVNFTDAQESAIGRPPIEAPRPSRIEMAAPSAGRQPADGSDFGWWLLLLAALLVASEWVMWRRVAA